MVASFFFRNKQLSFCFCCRLLFGRSRQCSVARDFNEICFASSTLLLITEMLFVGVFPQTFPQSGIAPDEDKINLY